MVDSNLESLPLLFPHHLFSSLTAAVFFSLFSSVCFESSSSPNTVAHSGKILLCVNGNFFFLLFDFFSRSLTLFLLSALLFTGGDWWNFLCSPSSLNRRMRLRVSSIFLNLLLLLTSNLLLIKFHTYLPP